MRVTLPTAPAVLVLAVLWFAVLIAALVWVGRGLGTKAGRLPLVVLAAALGAQAHAQTARPALPDTLSEAAAVARALAASPALRAAGAALDLAGADRAAASTFLTQPPVLSADAQLGPTLLPESDTYAFGLGLSQTLERPGVRRARRSAAGGRYAVAEAEARGRRFDAVVAVRAAVADVAVGQGTVRIARDALAAADTLVAVARLRYRFGDVSELDVRLAETDAAGTAAEALVAEAGLAQARAALARLLALPLGASVAVPALGALPPVPLPPAASQALGGPPPRVPQPDAPAAPRRPDAAAFAALADTTLLAQRPDVALAERAVAAAALDSDVRTRARRFSEFAVSLSVERSGTFYGPGDVTGAGPFGDDFRLGRAGTDILVGVSVPLPVGGLGDRASERAAAEVRLREAERDAVRFEAGADAAAALVRVQQAGRVTGRLAAVEAALPTTDALLELASRGGEIDVPTLIAQRERLRAVRRTILAARAEDRRARLALARALGDPAAGLSLDLD